MTSIEPTNYSSNNINNLDSSADKRQESSKISIFYDKNNNGIIDEEDFNNSCFIDFVKDNLLLGCSWSISIKEKLLEYAKTLLTTESVENNDIVSEEKVLGPDGDQYDYFYKDKNNHIVKKETYNYDGTKILKGIQYTYNEQGLVTKEVHTDSKGKIANTFYRDYDEQGREIFVKNDIYQWEKSYSEDGKTEICKQETSDGEILLILKSVTNDGSPNYEESGFFSVDGEKISRGEANSILYEYLTEKGLF